MANWFAASLEFESHDNFVSRCLLLLPHLNNICDVRKHAINQQQNRFWRSYLIPHFFRLKLELLKKFGILVTNTQIHVSSRVCGDALTLLCAL